MKHVTWCTGQFSEACPLVNVLCLFKEPFITLPHYIDCFLLRKSCNATGKNVIEHLNSPCLINTNCFKYVTLAFLDHWKGRLSCCFCFCFFFVVFYFILDGQLHTSLRVHFTKTIRVTVKESGRLYYILHTSGSFKTKFSISGPFQSL